MEECARGMGHSRRDAAVKGAQIKPYVEAYVGGMEQTAILTTDQLLLDQNTRRLLRL